MRPALPAALYSPHPADTLVLGPAPPAAAAVCNLPAFPTVQQPAAEQEREVTFRTWVCCRGVLIPSALLCPFWVFKKPSPLRSWSPLSLHFAGTLASVNSIQALSCMTCQPSSIGKAESVTLGTQFKNNFKCYLNSLR